ncbi:MAG: hypothetical protein C0392_04465 [Syntrophus sp. (in: bacteria)]|nr:hypothetical protein [Syntrophus sp. (in: bacteria)]
MNKACFISRYFDRLLFVFKNVILTKSLVFFLLLSIIAGRSLGGDCFIGKDCFAVVEPYLIERVCYLYHHEARTYKPGMESDFIAPLARIELHPDQLHVEFLKLLVDKKFMVLKRGTPIFSCRYDLETIKKGPDEAQLKGIVLPEFNCRGNLYPLVPVRVVNTNTCVWIAEADVRCAEQLEFQTDPFSLYEETLRLTK